MRQSGPIKPAMRTWIDIMWRRLGAGTHIRDRRSYPVARMDTTRRLD